MSDLAKPHPLPAKATDLDDTKKVAGRTAAASGLALFLGIVLLIWLAPAMSSVAVGAVMIFLCLCVVALLFSILILSDDLPRKPLANNGTHGNSQFANLASVQRSDIWKP